MTEYFKTVSGVLLAVVLGICLSRQAKDWSLLLTVAVCCAVLAVAVAFLTPVVQFVTKLQSTCQLDGDVFEILLKSVGMGLVGQLAMMICQDSGFASLGKGIQVLTTGAVLWLSLPLMESLMEVLSSILEGL